MAYREIVPSPSLRPFVDRFWIQTAEEDGGQGGGQNGGQAADEPAAHRVLPDGCIDVIVHLDDGGAAELVGTMTRAIVVPGGASRVAAVRFAPGGAAPLLGISAAELTDRAPSLGDVRAAARALPLDGVVRSDRDAPAAVAALLERRLLDRLARSIGVPRPDATVARAVQRLFSAQPPSMAALAAELGWSVQHLRRLFAQHVGISPKELGRVARLQRAVARLQRDPREPLAMAAVALGYFDQAHMARDFRLLAGATPAEVRAEVGSIFPIQSLLPRPQ